MNIPVQNDTALPPNPPTCSVLFCNAEDDFGDTVKPRFLAAGGDPTKASKVDGVRDSEGTLLPFHLGHIAARTVPRLAL